MSLILDVYPVPWKILERVKARILKNRAKKTKKAVDWSDVKREMSLQPGPLSRRRRDEPSFVLGGQVDVGVGWLHIGQNYSVLENTQNYDPTWSNGTPDGGPYDTWDPSSGPTTRRLGYVQIASVTLEFIITLGTRSGETWNRFRHTLNLNVQDNAYTDETRFVYYITDANGNQQPLIGSSSNIYRTISEIFCTRLWYSLFPAGQSELILVVTIAKFARTGFVTDSLNQASVDGVFALQSTKQISFLVTESTISELTHALPAFMQKQIDAELVANASVQNQAPYSLNNPDVSVEPAFFQPAIGTYTVSFNLGGVASSVAYEGIAMDGTFSAVSAQQAKASYVTYSGNAEIPVLRYKRDDPFAASTPTTERGSFGIIPEASVTAPVTSEMLAADLEDELEQSPGPNAANQPEPVGLVITYDYHGGSYCRDQLSRLGITLP